MEIVKVFEQQWKWKEINFRKFNIIVLYKSGPQPFWLQGPVSWKTGFPQIGDGGMVSGWFKHVTLIVHFISIIIIQLHLRESGIRPQRLGTPDLRNYEMAEPERKPRWFGSMSQGPAQYWLWKRAVYWALCPFWGAGWPCPYNQNTDLDKLEVVVSFEFSGNTPLPWI